jgi:hypothetical protein
MFTTTRSRQRLSPMALLGVAGLALGAPALSGTALAQSWLNPANGNWSTAGNWNPATAPNGANPITLGLAGPYAANLNYSLTLTNALSITNTEAVLSLDLNLNLNLTGTSVANSGRIIVNTSASAFTSSLFLNADQTLSGSGRLSLNANAGNVDTARFIRGVADPLLTNAAGHTIDGTGQFNDLRVTNNGTINANAPGLFLQFLGNRAVSNTGLLTASSGILQFNGSSVAQSPTGTISATGTGQVRLVNNANVAGGTLSTANPGFIAVDTSQSAGFGVGGGSPQPGPTNTGDFRVGINASLFLNNSFTNNGTLLVNPSANFNTSSIFINNNDTAISGNGTVALNASSGNVDTARFIRNLADPLLTIGSNQTVRGTGQFNDIRVTNNGTIQADISTRPITFTGLRTVTNNGTLSAINGATMNLFQTPLTSGPSGQINVGPGSSFLLFSNANISSGPINVNGTGTFAVATSNSAGLGTASTSVTLNGPMQVGINASLFLNSSLTNNGTITVNPSANGNTSSIFINNNDTTISGNGTVALNANSGNVDTARFIRNLADPLLTIGSNQTVRGSGQFNDIRVTNNGTINANIPGLFLQFTGNRAITNNNLITAPSGIVQFNGSAVAQSSSGIISATGTGQVRLVNNANVAGGTLSTTDSGFIAVDTSNGAGFGTASTPGPTNNGDFRVGINASLSLNNSFTNNGTLLVNPSANFNTSSVFLNANATINGTGTTLLNATAGNIDTARFLRGVADPLITFGPQQALAGSGNLNDIRTTVLGTLSPGNGNAGAGAIGRINFPGIRAFTLGPASVSNFQFRAGGFDQITGSANIALNGTLRLRTIDGYNPPVGTQFQIISANSVSGGFSTLDLSPLTPPNVWVVSVKPNAVVVSIGCNPSDMAFNNAVPPGDGFLDNGDFQLFINNFFTANCDGSVIPCNSADIADNGGNPGPDGFVDNGDFQLFIFYYFNQGGC